MSVETFDFQKYISEHRDPGARRRSLPMGEYAFRGDVQGLRALHGLAPVRLLLGATLRFWQSFGGRKQVMEGAARASEQEAPRVYEQAMLAARALKMSPQVVYLAPGLKGNQVARALGMEDEAFVAVQPMIVPSMDDVALRFFIGRELGHIQNGHTQYLTASFYADEVAATAVRWALTPALVGINRWRQRSELTADRAGLICARDLKAASLLIARHSLAQQRVESDVDAQAALDALAQDPSPRGRFWSQWGDRLPNLRLRVRALEAFSRSQYWQALHGQQRPDALTLSEVDDEVEEMLRGEFRS